MGVGAHTAAGTKLYMGTTALVASSDTYVEVAEVVNIPAFGRSYNEITYSPLSTRGVQKFKGSFNDGSVAVQLGKDLSDAGQMAINAAVDTDFDYNFKVEANDAVPEATSTVGISVATPGLVTLTAHGLPALTAVKFANGAGTLPTGLTAGTTYYICAGATLLANTFAVATTLVLALAGTGITTTGSAGVGNSMTTVPSKSYQLFKAKVMSFTTEVTTIDNVVMATASLGIKSGSLTEQVHLP